MHNLATTIGTPEKSRARNSLINPICGRLELTARRQACRPLILGTVKCLFLGLEIRHCATLLLLLAGRNLRVVGHLVPLLLDTLLSPLARRLRLRTLGVHLLLEDTLTRLLGLGLVDLKKRLAMFMR